MTSSTVPRSSRRGQLAQLLQELITVSVRLRSDARNAPADPDSFRAQIHQQVTAASLEASQRGYRDSDAGYAMYAVVAFLDESVLSSASPASVAWQGRPLQEELFGVFVGGDVFFEHLKSLLTQQDSEDLADVLEVYQLCLLLGFKGRYGSSHRDELETWITRLRDRLAQIRGPLGALSPDWEPPRNEDLAIASDPWQRRLRLAIGAVTATVAVLFVVYTLILRSRSRDVFPGL